MPLAMSPEEIILKGFDPINRAVDNYGQGQLGLTQFKIKQAMQEREMQQRYQQAMAQLAMHNQYATAQQRQQSADQMARDKEMQEWQMKRQLGVQDELYKRLDERDVAKRSREALDVIRQAEAQGYKTDYEKDINENAAAAQQFVQDKLDEENENAFKGVMQNIRDARLPLYQKQARDEVELKFAADLDFVASKTAFAQWIAANPKLASLSPDRQVLAFAKQNPTLGAKLAEYGSKMAEADEIANSAALSEGQKAAMQMGIRIRTKNLPKIMASFGQTEAGGGGGSSGGGGGVNGVHGLLGDGGGSAGGGTPAEVAPVPTAAVKPRAINQNFASAIPSGLIDDDTALKIVSTLTPDQQLAAGAKVRTELASTIGIPDIKTAWDTPGGEGVTPWTPAQGFKNMVRDTVGRPFSARERGEVLLGLLRDPQKGPQIGEAIKSLPPETKDYIYRKAFANLMTVPQGNQYYRDGAWQNGGFGESAMDIPEISVPAQPNPGAQWE